tara:strand:+ start:2629 stop:4059 length:1431 start_codon:yes stop_codon:yes gene_type:complete
MKIFLLILALFPNHININSDSKSKKPNILFFLVDDLGWYDVGYQGSKFYETPHIDSLSSKGMKFKNAYSAHPRCVPSRYGIMTGKYPARTKSPGPGSQLKESEYTIAEALRDNGYSTLIAGKWHLSRGKNGSSPEEQGFEKNYGGGDSGVPKSYFYPYNIQRRGRGNENAPDLTKLPEVEEGYHLTDQLTDLTLSWLDENYKNKKNRKPFFIYLSHYEVHTPFEGKSLLEEKYKIKKDELYRGENVQNEFLYESTTGETKLRQDNHIYAAMIENLDTNFGRVIEYLKENNLYRNTIIVFTSDHGGLSNRGNGRPLATSNLPLRAGKGHNYEGGIKVPLFVVWENKIVSGWSNTLVTGTDHFPTLLELIGEDTMGEKHLDGLSFKNSLTGKFQDNSKRPIFWHSPRPRPKSTGDLANTAIRLGDFKLLDFYREGRVELYNLKEDMTESKNLSETMHNKKEELIDLVRKWRKSVDATE